MLSKDDLQSLSPVARADHLGDRISRLAAQMTAREHALVHAIADFDRSGAFVEHGALSTVQWLGYRVGMSAATASEKLRVGHALSDLPKIDAAFATAKLSYSKVRALTRVATRANEAELLEVARCATASQLERICRHYRAVTCEATPVDAQVNRFVSVRQTDDGSTRITIQLPPDEGARFVAAIEAARAELNEAAPSAENDRPRADRADAAMALAESFFESGARPRRSGSPHEVVVHVDAAALAESSAGSGDAVGHIENAGGQGIGVETARRLCCDASISGVVTDGDGKLLDAGRMQRTVPAAMRRALVVQAGNQCQFPGCTHRHYLDAHHIVHWALGGATKLDNLILLCRRHHVFVHEHGWSIDVDAEGKRTFISPHGRVLEPSPVLSAEGLTSFSEAADDGRLDARGLAPEGASSPADYVYIIDVLMDRRRKRASAQVPPDRTSPPPGPSRGSMRPARCSSRACDDDCPANYPRPALGFGDDFHAVGIPGLATAAAMCGLPARGSRPVDRRGLCAALRPVPHRAPCPGRERSGEPGTAAASAPSVTRRATRGPCRSR